MNRKGQSSATLERPGTPIREEKSFPFAVKTFDDAQGIVTGYLSTFHNVDDGGDRVLPGAFKRTLANKRSYKQKHGLKYLFPFLWQHDEKRPIGGYLDAVEDENGLYVEVQVDLDVQQGREAYSGLKKGYIPFQSMGYDTLQSEWTQVDGMHVRDLVEVRLWEGSVVTFPMNTEAVVTGVKSLSSPEEKAVSGNTSGPIGPRDEAWDGGKAKKQIWAAATNDDGSINTSLGRKYFMVVDGDPQQKGSYGYPFWYVGESPHICVGAVTTIAAAIQGARGANAPTGLKAKVETLYKRINKKYPDDPQLSPPWKKEEENGDKSQTLLRECKTFEEHLAEEMCEDLLEDWQDVLICSLSCAVLDAFKIGDQPAADIQKALTAFNTAVLAWVDQGVQYGLSDYLEETSYTRSDADDMIQYGSESKPAYPSYWMSHDRRQQRKAGRKISAETATKIQAHVDALKTMGKEHMKAIHTAADDLATILQGSEAAYGTDPGTPEEPEGKAASHDDARSAQTPPSSEEDTVSEQELAAFLDSLRSLRVR